MTRDLTTREVLALLTGTNPPLAGGQVWQEARCHTLLLLSEKKRRKQKVIGTSPSCLLKKGQLFDNWFLTSDRKFIGVGLVEEHGS